MPDDMTGIADLHSRRERRIRKAPPPRHPKAPIDAGLGASDAVASPPPDLGRPEVTKETSQKPQELTAQSPMALPMPPAPATTALPRLDIDLTDPAVHVVSGTVLSVPASIMERFELARVTAPSHTAIVLDALRAHAEQLPTLILNRRPAGDPKDLFPGRPTPGAGKAQMFMQLRIRPTNGELRVMKLLADWSSQLIAQQRPGARATNRSEMVSAALDAYLPEIKRKR